MREAHAEPDGRGQPWCGSWPRRLAATVVLQGVIRPQLAADPLVGGGRLDAPRTAPHTSPGPARPRNPGMRGRSIPRRPHRPWKGCLAKAWGTSRGSWWTPRLGAQVRSGRRGRQDACLQHEGAQQRRRLGRALRPRRTPSHAHLPHPHRPGDPAWRRRIRCWRVVGASGRLPARRLLDDLAAVTVDALRARGDLGSRWAMTPIVRHTGVEPALARDVRHLCRPDHRAHGRPCAAHPGFGWVRSPDPSRLAADAFASRFERRGDRRHRSRGASHAERCRAGRRSALARSVSWSSTRWPSRTTTPPRRCCGR